VKDIGFCHEELIPFLVVSSVLVFEKNKMKKRLKAASVGF